MRFQLETPRKWDWTRGRGFLAACVLVGVALIVIGRWWGIFVPALWGAYLSANGDKDVTSL